MDKASLLGDAIAYINELQSKLQEAEVQIKDLKAHVSATSDKRQDSFAVGRGSSDNSAKKGLNPRPQGSGNSTSVLGESMGEKKPTITVHILGQEAMIRINCSRDSHASTRMMMALQESRLEIRHSNTSTTQDTVLHIFIVKVCCDLKLRVLNLCNGHLWIFFCIVLLGVLHCLSACLLLSADGATRDLYTRAVVCDT